MTLVAAATIALARLAPAARAAARAAAPVKHLAAMWLAQRDLNRLAGLSDRDLSDVGITRGDLFDIRASRWTADATRRLQIDPETAARRVC
ncbi:MAG: DUF1127 domain-containing protein [Notoacmeibacter sp.]|nr:DUF1127 domain-containing protein [Notoacmeibacter sp.]MCC0032521.1 DUF1127 domain-containing protein [Brucellaceae bacterium]